MKTKSTASMPFLTTLAVTANAASWASYGYFVAGAWLCVCVCVWGGGGATRACGWSGDAMIWGPNTLGLGAAFIQARARARSPRHVPVPVTCLLRSRVRSSRCLWHTGKGPSEAGAGGVARDRSLLCIAFPAAVRRFRHRTRQDQRICVGTMAPHAQPECPRTSEPCAIRLAASTTQRHGDWAAVLRAPSQKPLDDDRRGAAAYATPPS